jgi:AraC-like DNA-binding protein
MLTELLLELPEPRTRGGGLSLCAAVLEFTDALQDAFARLVGLLAEPRDIPVLAPLCKKEILYRILSGPGGPLLRQAALLDGDLKGMGRAIDWLRRHYAEKLSVAAIAARFGMSESSFHQRFKGLTAYSPIQYQKRLRLLEARRLLLFGGISSADAAYRVGYESPSQFSREYSRLFGAPPREDLKALKAGGMEEPPSPPGGVQGGAGPQGA